MILPYSFSSKYCSFCLDFVIFRFVGLYRVWYGALWNHPNFRSDYNMAQPRTRCVSRCVCDVTQEPTHCCSVCFDITTKRVNSAQPTSRCDCQVGLGNTSMLLPFSFCVHVDIYFIERKAYYGTFQWETNSYLVKLHRSFHLSWCLKNNTDSSSLRNLYFYIWKLLNQMIYQHILLSLKF